MVHCDILRKNSFVLLNIVIFRLYTLVVCNMQAKKTYCKVYYILSASIPFLIPFYILQYCLSWLKSIHTDYYYYYICCIFNVYLLISFCKSKSKHVLYQHNNISISELNFTYQDTYRVSYNLNRRHLTLLKQHICNCRYIHISHTYILQFIKHKNLSLGLLNPCSLGTRHDEFIVAMQRHGADIVAINETWLRAGEEARAPAPPGYRLRHVPRPAAVRSRGGGVGFYLKRGVYARSLEYPHSSSVEQMWLGVKQNGLKLAIGTAYRPPWLCVDTFIDAMTESVSSFSAYDHIILMGDFNINLLNTDDTNSKKLQDFIQSINLQQYVKEPTHFTDHSETLLDIVCSSVKVVKVFVDHIPDLSNHAFITFEINVKKPKPTPRWIRYRPIKSIDLQLFNIDLNNIPWENVLLDGDVNKTLIAFNKLILDLFNKHAPIKTSYVKEQSYPWITDTVKLMMKLRDQAYAKSRRTKLDCHKKYYKDLKSIVTAAIHSEKAAFFQHSINNHIKDSRKLWKNLKQNIVDFNKKNLDLPEPLLNPDLINNHFLNVPGNNSIDISQLTYFCFNRFSNSIFNLQPVDEATVLKILKNIKTNAQGVDGISLDMIMLTLPRTLGVITAIINMSIVSGIYPDIWKVSIIKPVPKVNDPLEFKDLRPISILPLMSKIVEKIVCMQMTKYLNDNNMLPKKQSGFRAGRSTATALLDVIDDILAGQDVGEGAILVLLDYSRAFDTINISLLIAKLTYYGLDDITLKWFSSYLTNRSQRVEVVLPNGTKRHSETSPVNRGVPQGSILGPLLFILYTADLPKCILNSKHHLYADDLQIYKTFKSINTDSNVNDINNDLNQIADWSSVNSLILNPAKTKFMIIGSKKQIENINSHKPIIKIANTQIDQVVDARNLGVLMDCNLKFEKHVLNCVKLCYFRLRVLYQIRQFINVNLRISLCESLILSKLNYADVVISGCLLGRTKKLIQRVQNSCARYCFSIPRRAHVTPYLNKSDLMNMESRRALHFASLLFGVNRHQTPVYLFEKLKFTHRQSRIIDRLICPPYNTAAFRGSFRYSATKCWNNIPPPIRSSATIYTFKLKYKSFLLNLQKST